MPLKRKRILYDENRAYESDSERECRDGHTVK
jgi:hypothetical protein